MSDGKLTFDPIPIARPDPAPEQPPPLPRATDLLSPRFPSTPLPPLSDAPVSAGFVPPPKPSPLIPVPPPAKLAPDNPSPTPPLKGEGLPAPAPLPSQGRGMGG